MITLDGGGFDTNDVFNKALNWTSSFVKSLNRSVAQGRTNIGVMQMTGQANLACHTGYTKKEIKVNKIKLSNCVVTMSLKNDTTCVVRFRSRSYADATLQ